MAMVFARHLLPLLTLIAFDTSVAVYLVLALFDLGVSYAGPQLYAQGALVTRHFVAYAQSGVERCFAYLLLPAIITGVGMLVVLTGALFLLPLIVASDSPLAADLRSDAVWMAVGMFAVSLTAARQLDRQAETETGQAGHATLRAESDRRAGRLAGLLGVYLILAPAAMVFRHSTAAVWLMALVFALLHAAVDLRDHEVGNAR